jgi:hypothetical protein
MAKHPSVSIKIGDSMIVLPIDIARDVARQIHEAVGAPIAVGGFVYANGQPDPYLQAVAARADVERRTF